VIDVSIFDASDEATAGSVIAKHERISPASSGFSQRAFCSSEPYADSNSMLPTSGALQLKISGAASERPSVSHRCAYSKLFKPWPPGP
jgi:hypothetical protein